MSVRIASNVAALQSERRVAQATSALGKSFERLSSGLRINRAGDDAAGLAIAESLRADVQVYSQAVRNINDGISALDIAEGAIRELSFIAIRQNELAEQAANGVYSNAQRLALDTEADALVREYNRIIESTVFNGRNLLDSSFSGVRVQAGYGLDGSITIGIGDALSRLAGDGTFAAGAVVTNNATAATSADLNGDGVEDLVMFASGGFQVSLGIGDGTFKSAQAYSSAGGGSSVAASDVNGDGILDLLTARSGGPNSLNVLLGNGNGTFKAYVTFEQAWGAVYEMVSGDFNHDGFNDVAVQSWGGSQGAHIMLSNGNGTFKAGVLYDNGGTNTVDIDLGDFNGDGNLDFGVSDDGGMHIYLGNADGTLRYSQYYGLSPNIVSTSTFGDINGDGNLDFVLSSSAHLYVRLGQGDGTFSSGYSFATTANAASMKLIDTNGDDALDLVTVDSATSTLSVMLGNGNGSFRQRTTTAIGPSPTELVAADFNEDGVLDLLIAENGSGNGQVYNGNTRGIATIEELDLLTATSARSELDTTRETLTRIARELGNVGSYQARLQVAAQNLLTARENFSAARSQIVDADLAQESAQLVRNQILQNAATEVLRRTSDLPALALRLLS